MNLVFQWMILSALVLAASPPDRAGDAQTASGHSSPPSTEPQNPPPTADHAPPTAEDVLRALQHSQPTIEIIRPVHGGSADTVTTKQKLLPEGAALVDKIGRVEQDPTGYAFIFEDAGKPRRLRLLPNATLDVMTRTDRHAPMPISFAVSGELTVFHDENYLLPRLAMRASSPSNTEVSDSTASMHDPAAPAGDAPAPPPPARTVRSVEDVAAALSAAKPTKLAVDPEVNGGIRDLDSGSPPHLPRPTFARGSGRNSAFARTIHADGTMLINRPGRLIEHGSRWMFAPESDHRDFPEPPLHLLPCRNTEMMIRRLETEKLGVVFLVSGEITLFEGENYLLPRVATRQLVSDNLRK